MITLTEVENTDTLKIDMTTKFIVIDDDPLNNTICRLTIKKAVGAADVITFTNPEEGLSYLKETYDTPIDVPTVLFLDINMPIMSGWEFLEHYNYFSQQIKDNIKVYVLSSSVDDRDVEKAKNNPNIITYLSKPITKETIFRIIGK